MTYLTGESLVLETSKGCVLTFFPLEKEELETCLDWRPPKQPWEPYFADPSPLMLRSGALCENTAI